MEGKQITFDRQTTSKKVRVWGKGQLTIPSVMRKKLGIKESTILDIYHIGNALVLTPERLLVKELATEFSAALPEKKVNLDELLSELRESSHEYETD